MLEQTVGCTLDKHLNDPLRTPLLYFQLETLFTLDKVDKDWSRTADL